jgi:hypothetical protein
MKYFSVEFEKGPLDEKGLMKKYVPCMLEGLHYFKDEEYVKKTYPKEIFGGIISITEKDSSEVGRV